MHNITIAHKMDMSYDFYNRHNMHAVERKFIAMINKNKNLINKFFLVIGDILLTENLKVIGFPYSKSK